MLRRILGLSGATALLLLASCGGNRLPNLGGVGDPCTGAWVRLFDDANFRGRLLTVAYPTSVPSLTSAGTDSSSGDLNDRVSSARWSIPPGCRLVLFEDENFKGSPFRLIGSGRSEENPNLGTFGDRASSASWERS